MARQVLMLDTIASRYHCLPSEVVERADTFDIFIVNTALGLHAKAREEEERRANRKGPPVAPRLTQEQMEAMLASVDNKNGKEHTES